MKKLLVAVSLLMFLLFGAQDAYTQPPCQPSPQPATPGKVASLPDAPGRMADNLAEIEGAFDRGESRKRTVYLKKGTSYWVSAAGCPRAGNIKIYIAQNGQELSENESYDPRFCFTPQESGDYTFWTKLVTTLQNSRWGNVKSRIVQLEKPCK